MSEILDSGARRNFASGAVRDIQEGKGRCDLLPLDTVASIINDSGKRDDILLYIDAFIHTGNSDYIFLAIKSFIKTNYVDMTTAILEVSKHYEAGALKYKERNWEKGIPLHCFIDSGVRHYLKYIRGDDDEPHDRAFIWNMLGVVWTYNHIPECIDLPFKDSKCYVSTETVDADTLRNIGKTFKEKCNFD